MQVATGVTGPHYMTNLSHDMLQDHSTVLITRSCYISHVMNIYRKIMSYNPFYAEFWSCKLYYSSMDSAETIMQLTDRLPLHVRGPNAIHAFRSLRRQVPRMVGL